MDQERFGIEDEGELDRFEITTKVKKNGDKTSVDDLLSEGDDDKKCPKKRLMRAKTGQLLQLKVRKDIDKSRYSQNLFKFMNGLIDNLSCFDDSLKLKIQMSLDIIQQDFAIWQE